MILPIYDLQETLIYLLPSFKSIGLSAQENKFKIYFQVGSHGAILDY